MKEFRVEINPIIIDGKRTGKLLVSTLSGELQMERQWRWSKANKGMGL